MRNKKYDSLKEWQQELTKCFTQHEDYRERKLVLGEGKCPTDIMFIGEAPGGQEEEQGRPFVGKAGSNLNRFIDVLKVKREDMYITNVVKVRPTAISSKTGNIVNRPPNPIEIEDFRPWLLSELDIVFPKIIVTLGNVPLKALVGAKATIGEYHGKAVQGEKNILFPLYHPASIIYNAALKDIYENDLKILKIVFDGVISDSK